MRVIHTIETVSEQDTQAFAAKIAKACSIGDCVALQGDLGAGKTTFSKGFINALAPDAMVTSPTFTLMQLYETSKCPLYHYDLYRLRHVSELQELGFDESLENGITLVEWPEIAKDTLPTNRLHVEISNGHNDQSRIIVVSGNASWYEKLKF